MLCKVNEDGSLSEVASNGSSENIYSTVETKIGTWIDGKPLYRKTFVIPTVVYQAYTSISGATGIKELIKYYGFVHTADGVFSVGRWVTTSVRNGTAQYYDYDIPSPKSMTITLEYTKIVD